MQLCASCGRMRKRRRQLLEAAMRSSGCMSWVPVSGSTVMLMSLDTFRLVSSKLLAGVELRTRQCASGKRSTPRKRSDLESATR